MESIDDLPEELAREVERAYEATRSEDGRPWASLAPAEQKQLTRISARAKRDILERVSAERRPAPPAPVSFEALHAALVIRQPIPAVVIIEVSGYDVGEFGKAPFRALEELLGDERRFHLFIDARRVQGASIDVTGDWAAWLGKRRSRVESFSILVGTPFIRITADFVSRFASLEDRTRVFTHEEAFDLAVAITVALAS